MTAAQQVTSIDALFVVLLIVWFAAAILWATHGMTALARWVERREDRRSIRRCQRASVRAVRGLGADLLRDEACLRGQR